MTQNPGQMEPDEVLLVKLEAFRAEHRELDEQIRTIEDRRGGDLLEVRRLKKHKLRLKDEIAALKDRLTPDIIA